MTICHLGGLEMSCDDFYYRLLGYERDKQALPTLPPKEYEQAVKRLADKWEI